MMPYYEGLFTQRLKGTRKKVNRHFQIFNWTNNIAPLVVPVLHIVSFIIILT